MTPEIEVKFLETDHDQIRTRLQELGGTCTKPLANMRRAIIDYPDKRLQKETPSGWGWIRVRDESGHISCTYKHIATDGKDTTHEIEFTVSSYEKAVQLFEAIGLMVHAEQETKREVWELYGVEIMLDEWPWIPPYIEIEGSSETAIRDVAEQLGQDWNRALRGSSDRAYRVYYPGMKDTESIGDMPELTFGANLPQWLKDRQEA